MDENYYINAMWKIWRLKGNSERTISTYMGYLKRYLAHFKVYPETITNEQRVDYFLKFHDASTRNQAMAVIRQLHEHLLKQPIDWRDLPYTKKKETLPEYFTEEEVKQLLAAIRNPKHKCFIALQFSCGLRVSEVLNIKQTDINTKDLTLRINGKGSKQRDINLPETVIPYIKAYWGWVSPTPKMYLFEGQYGGRYSSRSIQIVLSEAKQKCNLAHKKCSTHGLRHAAATQRINKLGWNTRQVQCFLGHKNIKTTERYTHVGVNDFKELAQPVI